MKSFKTEVELEVGKSLENIFVNCPDRIEMKLENFPKYVRRQHLKRFLAMYEIFKLILPVKGSIVDCASVSDEDRAGAGVAAPGDFQTTSYDELLELIRVYDQDRFLGHLPKVELIPGDASKTIPQFVQRNTHLLVSLLFLDFDLYVPTKVSLEQLVPRMPKGAVLAFDELDNPIWPGETKALLDSFPVNRLKIQRLEWDPYIGFVILE